MTNVLVAGGNGFIGQWLVRHLIDLGHGVDVMTRDGKELPDGCTAVPVARWSADDIAAIGGERSYDWVINLTAYGVDHAEFDEAAADEGNVGVPVALLELANRRGASVFLHSGSAFEYSQPADGQLLSENCPTEADSVYAQSKARGTQALLDAGQDGDVAVIVARIFGVYGPGEKSYRLLPSLVRDLAQGKRVALSAGTQVRDVLYVKDVAAAIVALCEAADAQKTRQPVVLNLCSGEGVSVRNFAETVADVMGVDRTLLEFGAIPIRPHEIPFLVGETTRLSKFTNWKPANRLRDGLEDAISEMGVGNA